MSERLQNVNLGFNDTKEASHDLQIDQATIDAIVNQVEDKPLVFSTPLGDITILNSKRDTVRNLIQNNPIKPTVKIIYQSKGDCRNFDNITITAKQTPLTGTTGINLTAFGFGVEIEAKAEITEEVMKETPCQKQGEAQQVQNFRIDWYLDISIAPGGKNTQFIKRCEQLVSTPCCNVKKNGEQQTQPNEPKDGGGWFG